MKGSSLSLKACHYCDTPYHLKSLNAHEVALCGRCGTKLEGQSQLRCTDWLALTCTALILFVVALIYPVATLSLSGSAQQVSLLEAIWMTAKQGYLTVALMTGLTSLIFPLCQLGLLLCILLAFVNQRIPPKFILLMRLLNRLHPWCMVPVCSLGMVVALIKLKEIAWIDINAGLTSFMALTILLTVLDRLGPRRLWHYAEMINPSFIHVPVMNGQTLLINCSVCGQVQAAAEKNEEAADCLRCHTVISKYKPDHLIRTWVLLITAIILYIPANVLPIMRISSLFNQEEHTIFGGVVELWRSGSWGIALIVFVASIVVPFFKLFSLGLLAFYNQIRSPLYLRTRTRLYVTLESIGQWSMLDVFAVILLVALAHFPGRVEISMGVGATAFGLVVIFTMLAAMSFDPRKAWSIDGR